MQPVRFAHISDSHVRDADARDVHLQRLDATVDELNRLHATGVPIDAVVHTGDLVDAADAPDADAAPTKRALAALERLAMPWYLIGGNHDRREFLIDSASCGRVMSAQDAAPVDTVGSIDAAARSGVRQARVGALALLFLDANPQDGEGDLHGRISDDHLTHLDALLRADTVDGATIERHALFLHYPPCDQGAGWTGRPERADALCALLERHAARLAGVFAGHVHRGVHQLKNGVLYVSAPAMSRHFLLWPDQDVHADERNAIVPWHHVHIGSDGTRIQQHAFLHTPRAGN